MYNDESYGRFASQFWYAGKKVKESLELGLHGEFVDPAPGPVKGIKRLLKTALEGGDCDFKPVVYRHAIAYTFILQSLRKTDSPFSDRKLLTKRMWELYNAFENKFIPFSMSERDAKSLIGICNEIVEVGGEHINREVMADEDF